MTTTLSRRNSPARSSLPSIFTTEPFGALRDEFDHILANWFNNPGNPLSVPSFAPLLDMSETDSSYEVKMDLPGVKANEIQVQILDNVLTIRGERKCDKSECKDKGGTPHHVERYHGTFSRSILLPAAVKQDKIDAQYRDGVLTVSLPKAENVKPCHITIKT